MRVRSEAEDIERRTSTITNTTSATQDVYSMQPNVSAEQTTPSLSSFYRPHDPQIIMDDPLSSLISQNDTYNISGRYSKNFSKSSLQSHSNMQQNLHNSTSEANLKTENDPHQKMQSHKPIMPASPLAGMYNASPQTNVVVKKSLTLYSTPSPTFDPIYGDIMVNDPRMVSSNGLFGGGPPHWTYNVTTLPKQGHSGSVIEVRRRFRHFVALEDRLRDSCPGSILPPR